MGIKLPDYNKVITYFTEHPLWVKTLEYTQNNSLIGFHGVSIYDIVVFVYNELTRDDLFTRANSIAFSFFLSLFPSILTLFTLTPFILNVLIIWFPDLANFNTILYEEIKQIMPGQAGDILFGFVQDVTNQPKFGLLSFGFLLSFYFSTNGVVALMQAFEKSYAGTFKQRGILRKRLVATGLTVVVGSFIFSSVVLVVLGNNIINLIDSWFDLGRSVAFFLNLLRWLVMLALYYITIGTLFRYGGSAIRRFTYFSPGVNLAAILSLLTSVAFSIYIDRFNRYDTYAKFYGSIATVIIVMLWMQLNALILIIGYELNAAIAVHRDLSKPIEESVDEEEEEQEDNPEVQQSNQENT